MMSHEPLMVNIGDLTPHQQRDILYMITCLRVRNNPEALGAQRQMYDFTVMHRTPDSDGIEPYSAPLVDTDTAPLDQARWQEEPLDYTDDEAWK